MHVAGQNEMETAREKAIAAARTRWDRTQRHVQTEEQHESRQRKVSDAWARTGMLGIVRGALLLH